jgi:O-antigen ligase
MIQAGKHLIAITRNPERLIVLLVFLSPALLLSLKGAATTILFLVFFVCAGLISRDPQKFFIGRGRQFWVIIFFLLTPFLTELIVQLGRGVFILSSLDGPSRTILAAGVFIYLSKQNLTALISALSIGSAVGIVLVFLSFQLFPEYFWEHRAATYFVDPITLACYVFVLLGIFLFKGLPTQLMRHNNFAKLLVTALAVYIAIVSQSRSAWVAGLVLLEVYVLWRYATSPKKQVLATLCILLGAFMIFHTSDIVKLRSQEAAKTTSDFLESAKADDTSVGLRLGLLQLDFRLIRSNLYLGVPDREIPSFEDLKSVYPDLTRQLYDIKLLAGSHSEFLGQVVGKGVIFGALSLWGLFCYPFFFLSCHYRRLSSLVNDAGGVALGLIVPVAISAMFIQVFNLKMTISFYVMVLAILYAHIFYLVLGRDHGQLEDKLNVVVKNFGK